MMMKHSGSQHTLIAVLIMLFLISLSCGTRPPSGGHGDYNIVLITIDTLRADHLSCYGYERDTTPNIDNIAEKGMIFKNAIAPSSWTAPSMASLLTSTYPINHGVIHGIGYEKDKTIHRQEVFSDELTTLAEILKNHGYTTFGIASNLHLSEKFGFARGFDFFQCLPFLDAPIVNSILFSWMQDIKQAEKYFIWLHYFDPHHFYHPRKPWIENYTSEKLTEELGLYKKNWIELKQVQFKKDPLMLANLVALYDSEINYVDSFIGELIQKFELDNNTLLIITSDHGEEFLEHDQLGHGNNLYRETIHIPLIMKSPHSSKKEIIHRQVNLVDIMPTILHILNINLPEQIQGQSLFNREGLLSWLTGLFSDNAVTDYEFSELANNQILKTIITPGWKYIYNYKDKTEQLYNIASDPPELNNLADKEIKQSNQLKEQLFNWVSRAKKYPTQKQQADLSAEEKEKLKSLGYMQ